MNFPKNIYKPPGNAAPQGTKEVAKMKGRTSMPTKQMAPTPSEAIRQRAKLAGCC